MMTIIVIVFEAAGLTVSENKTETNTTADTEPGTPDLPARHRSSRPEVWTGNTVLFLGSLVNACADIKPEITRRVRNAWAYYSRFKRELHDMEAAPFTRGAHVKGRGMSANGTPQVSPTYHWLPAPTTR